MKTLTACRTVKSCVALVGALALTVVLAGCSGCSDPLDTHSYRVRISVQGSGRVTGAPADTLVRAGTVLRLTAVPDTGSMLIGWYGIPFTTANPLDLTVKDSVSLTATFGRPPSGLAFIHAKDSSFKMGSAGVEAKEYEKPVHTVRFAHDFYLGRCPITQKEYAAITGSNPCAGSGNGDVGDSFPVYNVTWYDAVLYCNMRSKLEHYDTVYSYTAVCKDSICPFVLENLQIHYDRFGYRLPTEAEWEYACRAGSTTEYFWGASDAAAATFAWYFSNSADHAHKVGTLQPNGFGLFDMAGNVAEWVNDWLAYYADSTITDPVGPTQLSQAEYEASSYRPLRGGSYRLGAAFMRSACRQGPYTTTAFARDRDIGFRVALGAFNAASGGSRPARADTFPIALSCSKSDLISFLGSTGAKVAFTAGPRGSASLVFLDLSQPDPVFFRCGRDSSICGTVISPDGHYIAYSSNGEGTATACTLTVRRLDTGTGAPARITGAYLPHFWVSPATADTFLLYTNGASRNNSTAWLAEQTFKRVFRGGVLAPPAVEWANGSYCGGLSSDGRFLGTSYPVGRAVDFGISNARYDTNVFYFCYPFNGRADSALPQLCNLEMSPSLAEPGEASFLDFGDPSVNTIVGKSYDWHQVLWIANLRLLIPQQVSNHFEKPAGYESWDYPRWANNSKFLVAIAHLPAGDSDAVFLIRRSDGSYLKLATGRRLSYPALWIDPLQVSDTNDPFRWFGSYDLPPQSTNTIYMADKLRLFWHYRGNYSVIAMGNSPLYFGFNPAGMAEPSLNAATTASNPITSAVFCQNYLLPHSPGLKVLVFDLSSSFMDADGLTEFPQLVGVMGTKGWQLDSANNFYRNGIPQVVLDKSKAFTQAANWPGFDSAGALVNPPLGGGWGYPEIDGKDFSFASSTVKKSLSYIAALADSVAAHHVHLVLVEMPENPAYPSQTGMLGRWGPSIATYRQIAAWVDTLTKKNGYVHFWDANNYGNHDFADSEALDANHLNARGGMRFSAKLDSLIKLWVPGGIR